MFRSKEMFDAAKRVMPGGVNSPVRAFRSVGLDPIFIASGKGSRITDADGNEYIDYVGSWGPLILGHAHDEVLETLKAYASRGTSFGAPTELEIRLAEKIVEMVPSVEMVRLVNSGTEATMSAIRLARAVTGRSKIVKFEGCYHGHGDAFLVKAGSGALTLGEPSSPGVPPDTARNTLSATFNDVDSASELFEKNGRDIAAVIVEPIAGNMGVIPPAPGFLDGLRKMCDQYGSLLVFDEVMTGFRVHPGGAQALYGILPDITTMGKVIGGGLPVAAYGASEHIMSHVAPEGPVYQAGTLSGNPLAVAAGLKTLEIITRPGFFDSLNEKAASFFDRCASLVEDGRYPVSLNYVNSMGCIFFRSGGVKSYADAVASDTALFSAYFKRLLEAGVYVAPSQYEALFISAAHSDDDLNVTLGKMSDALEAIFA